jgi:hypothetical protein
MEKKIAGVLGAIAAFGTLSAAQAAPAPGPTPTDILQAGSYAELLEPIPNAAALLRVVDEQGPVSSASANIHLAQYHHHHHHHHYRRPPRIVVVPHRHHHHHHHHHHHYRRY